MEVVYKLSPFKQSRVTEWPGCGLQNHLGQFDSAPGVILKIKLYHE